MKKTCAQLKDSARECLLGHYGVLITATLLVQLITTILNIPFTRMINTGTAYLAISRIILGYAGSFVVSLLTVVLTCSLSFMHLKIARREDVRSLDLLYCFKNHPDRYLGYAILIMVISFAFMIPGIICISIGAVRMPTDQFTWNLFFTVGIVLFVICGIILIIIMLGLSQTIFLLLDHPEITVRSAMKWSMQHMKGNKGRLFRLWISFIGWALLGLLTLGIGFLWIEPYVNQSLTQFYQNLVLS